ncbi:MAG: hypothetical protein DRO23_01070 [Thermoprotei archaeon]|nr:MAG: hypothetical protein DRO23_01070 [Thermoprotei archaeon]
MVIVTTTSEIPGYRVAKVLGVVTGSTVRAKHIGKDILAAFRHIVGGEVKEYTEMLREARQQAIERMIEEAKKLGADAIVNVRFMTSAIAAGAAEILAYGTAVKLEPME